MKKYVTDEWCPDCCSESRYEFDGPKDVIQKCPNCNEFIVLCSACSHPFIGDCASCEAGNKFKLHPDTGRRT